MSWKHLEDTTPKARKKYRCHLCGLSIDAGDKYIKRTGVDGEFIMTRMHIKCEKLTDNWNENDWENFDEAEFRGELAKLEEVK